MTLPLPSAVAAVAAQAYAGPWRWVAGDVHVLDARLGTYRVVAFRGTTRDGFDILRDVRCAPWWFRRVGFVPAGFGKGVAAVIDAILLDAADDLLAGKLIVCGHSLGARMALIAAGWMAALGHPPAGTYAFEPPRGAWFKLRRLLRKLPYLFACRDGNDLVVRVPFIWLQGCALVRVGRPRLDPLECHKIAVVADDLRAAGL